MRYHSRVNLATNGPGTTRKGSNKWQTILLRKKAIVDAVSSWNQENNILVVAKTAGQWWLEIKQ